MEKMKVSHYLFLSVLIAQTIFSSGESLPERDLNSAGDKSSQFSLGCTFEGPDGDAVTDILESRDDSGGLELYTECMEEAMNVVLERIESKSTTSLLITHLNRCSESSFKEGKLCEFTAEPTVFREKGNQRGLRRHNRSSTRTKTTARTWKTFRDDTDTPIPDWWRRRQLLVLSKEHVSSILTSLFKDANIQVFQVSQMTREVMQTAMSGAMVKCMKDSDLLKKSQEFTSSCHGFKNVAKATPW